MIYLIYILFVYCVVAWIATIVDIVTRPQESWDELGELLSESEFKSFLPRWLLLLIVCAMFVFMTILAPVFKTEQWLQLLKLWYYSRKAKRLRNRIIGDNQELREKLEHMSTEEENRYWRLLAANLEKAKQE